MQIIASVFSQIASNYFEFCSRIQTHRLSDYSIAILQQMRFIRKKHDNAQNSFFLQAPEYIACWEGTFVQMFYFQ